MDSTPIKNINEQEEDVFSLKDFFKLCLRKWYWFMLCLIFALTIGLFYIYRQQPVYERYEQILITEQDSGGGMDVTNAFSTLGLFSKNSNVYNELISLTSPAIMYEVVDRLQLDMNYFHKKGIRTNTLYGENLPVRIDMLDIKPQGSASFRLSLNPDGSIKMWKFSRFTPDGKIKYDQEVTMPAGVDEIKTPIGRVKISPNPDYNGGSIDEPFEIRISKMPMQATVELYSNKLKGDFVDSDAEVIQLSIRDVSVERAVDILNSVLAVYNQNWLDDKNKMSVATSKFIDERLAVIQSELGDVDINIAEYMKKTGTPDFESSIKLSMETEAKVSDQLLELNNLLSMAEYLKSFIENKNNETSLLPGNLGFDNATISSQVLAYNEMLLNRNTIASSSSDQNPLVENYDNQLTKMRRAILESINNQIVYLHQTIANLSAQSNKVSGKMAETPMEALPLLSEERQQKVKESLYLFLLQKREENELSQKFVTENTRIITPPIGSLEPVAPRKGLIIVITVILGLGIPFVLLYILESSNTTVRGKKDLEGVLMPFAGEIPHVGKKKKLKVDKGKGGLGFKKDEKPPLAVVEEGKRDVVNEAFRVMRSNLDFMAGKNNRAEVIMLTSFNPGSGKSFISYNLGLSFALKHKRVLIIDCDLRHGSSSMYVGLPAKGLSNYLTGSTDDWRSLVVPSPANKNLEILPIGKMPPNPAELLENGRLKEIIEEAKDNFDVIFLDCPPVNIVVDTQIVGQYADRTLFVVRAGLLERSALKELNEFYQEKKFKNMSLILNGTEAAHSRYYTYGNYQNLN